MIVNLKNKKAVAK